MNDQDQFGARLAGFLDDGAAGLRPGVAYRLQAARARALARLSADPEPAIAPAGIYTLAGAGGPSFGPSQPVRAWSRARWILAGALVVAALVGWQQWRAWSAQEEIEDIDTHILTSDLPIDAYLDRGFQQWLINASHPQ